jgi:hypothetical protein
MPHEGERNVGRIAVEHSIAKHDSFRVQDHLLEVADGVERLAHRATGVGSSGSSSLLMGPPSEHWSTP